MKATISELEASEAAVWESEVISADWDGRTGEFVIGGTIGNKAFAAVLSSVAGKQRLTIQPPT